VWDTQIMARLLHPQVNGNYNLIAVAAQVGVPTTKEQREMKGERKNLHKLPVQKVIEYAFADAMVTFLIYEAQQALIQDATTADLVDWEMRAMREYCRMAAQGVKLNLPYVKARALELHETVKQTSARLRADGLANPGSTQQRAKYIYEKKGIPRPDPDENPEYFTETGGLSTKRRE
jgi:DNA polymerase I-like protein with 3'-5' exonuclease and polymerase domains